MVREVRVFDSVNTRPVFGVGYSVVVLEPGAMASAASSGTTITVQPGHGFAAGDYLIVGLDATLYRLVGSVTSTTLSVNANTPISIGDLLVNLGQDTSAGPTYQASGVTIYTDSGYTTVATDSHVRTDIEGRARYWHRGIERWELVLGELQEPLFLFIDTNVPEVSATSFQRDMSVLATSGSGTEDDPWEGWDPFCVEGYESLFPSGFYATSTLSIPITQDNAPSRTTLRGDGSGSSIITITVGSGQLRVYGVGTAPVTLHGVVICGLCIRAGADNTSSGLMSLENFDIGCYVDDILIDATALYSVAVGAYVLNGEQFRIGSLYIRGWSSTALAAGNLTVGHKVYTDDGIQRGDVRYDSLYITNATTGLIMSSSGGSIADTSFGLVKIVNGTLVNGTLGVSLASNVEQVTFTDLHVEAFNNGLQATSVENLFIGNGLFNLCSNVGVSSGASITITNGDGGIIMARIANTYNGIVLDGTTSRYFYVASASSGISGTLYTDSSSGLNTHLRGNEFQSAMGCAGLFSATGGLSLATLGTILTIASGIVTVTKSNHQLDTEGAAATDDLDTISGGSDGQILVLCCNSNSRTVVCKDGTGNLLLAGDFPLDNSEDQITLVKRNTNWIELSRSDNGESPWLPRNIGTWQPPTSTPGTYKQPTTTEMYVGSLFIPAPVTVTGIKYLIGTAVPVAQKLTVALFDASGAKVAASTTSGTSMTTSASVTQSVAFTAAYKAFGPGWYFIGLMFDTATANLFCVVPTGADAGSGVVGSIVTGLTALTPPTSISVPATFTAAAIPVASVY